MKMNVKAIAVFLVLMFVMGLSVSPEAGAGQQTQHETLYYLIKGYRPVNVYIGEFINSSGHDRISIRDFRAALKKAFENRKSANFIVVKTLQEADISIAGEIIEYDYREIDPLDMAVGWGGMLMDQMDESNYVALRVKYVVGDAQKQGRILWSKVLHPSITEENIPEETCLEDLLPVAAEQVVSKCFRRPRTR
jgi:hypothetical protein